MILTRRTVCILLTALILLGMLAGCGGNKETASQSIPATGEVTTQPPELPPNDTDDLPEGLDFGGKTITLYAYVQSETVREFLQETDVGSEVPYAVYARNRKVESRLNCNITAYERVGDTNTTFVSDEITNMIASGLTTYQIITTAGYRMCGMANNGMFLDLLKLEYINTGKDYYSEGYNKALSIGDSQYLVTGKFSLSYYRYMIAMLFNKTLFNDGGVDYPYQTVLEGNWDFEEAARLSKLFYKDINGDGIFDVSDTYGYVMWVGSGSSLTDGYMASAGLRVIGKDGENYFKADISSAANFSKGVDNILSMMYNEGSYTSPNYFDVIKKFSGGTAALTSFRMFHLEETAMGNFGATGLGYGILPLPKSDADGQAEYYSYIQDQCLLFGLPKTLGSSPMLVQVSQFLEAYASESYRTLKPAYYEKALTARYATDTQSQKMLAIMDSTTFVDPANVYIGAGFSKLNSPSLRDLYASGTNTVSSMLEKQSGLTEQIIQMNENYRKMAQPSA